MAKPYKSYKFVGRDPVIDKVLDLIPKDKKFKSLSEESGVSATTLYNWRNKKTSRPQFCTLQATALSLGYTFKLSKGK